MSDIGILNSPLAIAFLLALFGGPGLAAGAVIGALLWRRHRVIGGLTAAIFGFAISVVGWLYFNDSL
jgi:hypothetical protein